MSNFYIKADDAGQPTCLLEVKDSSFEQAEQVVLDVMDEVDGLASVGCSGGQTVNILIHGSSIRSVIEAVQYCEDNLTTVVPG